MSTTHKVWTWTWEGTGELDMARAETKEEAMARIAVRRHHNPELGPARDIKPLRWVIRETKYGLMH